MRTVWKYPLEYGTNKISVPRPYRIVHVGLDPAGDHLMPCVWIEVPTHPNAPGAQVVLQFIGTGMSIEDGWDHVGTAITPGGLVWHVYSKGQP